MFKKTWIVPVVTLGVAAILLLVITGGWTSWESSRSVQQTDDAFIRADITPLSTRISGTVRKIEVNDYESVKAGQLLVQFGDDEYRAVLEEAKAALAGAQAELENNQAAKLIQDAKVKSAETMVAQAASAVNAARAGVAAVQPDADRSATERKRQESLFALRAATKQQLEVASADADRFSGMLASRQADLERAQSAVESSRAALEAERRQRHALDVKDSLIRASIQAKQAAIIVANVNLGYTKILSPTAGAVGQRHIQEGQLVSPGRQIIDVVNGDVWIQANYKETQIANIRKGDVADIEIDSFPGVVLHGKVAEIAPASGSQFALLPPDNATGNFTKVVQRVSVKIVLDPGHPLQDRLRPGFSVIVNVHASGKKSTSGSSQS